MPKRDEMIDFTIPTESDLSIVEGRNGTFLIKALRVWESHDRVRVYLEGIGAKRGMTIRGGLRVSLECFAEACRRFLTEYDAQGSRCELCGYAGPLLHAPGSTACKKRQGEQMEVPAGQTYPREDTCKKCGHHLGWIMNEAGEALALGRCENCPAGEQTVSAEWNMRCPECGSDEAIEIAATVYVRLTHDGTDIFDTHNGDHEWDKDSTAYCAKCSHAGTVADFEIQKEGEAMEVPAGEKIDEYHLVECDKSFCPTCTGKVMLLCSDDAAPQFFICWTCKTVAKVGAGPVEKEGEAHEV